MVLPKYKIRTMSRDEIDIAIEWAASAAHSRLMAFKVPETEW